MNGTSHIDSRLEDLSTDNHDQASRHSGRGFDSYDRHHHHERAAGNYARQPYDRCVLLLWRSPHPGRCVSSSALFVPAGCLCIRLLICQLAAVGLAGWFGGRVLS